MCIDFDWLYLVYFCVINWNVWTNFLSLHDDVIKWKHLTFSALLAICVGNSLVTVEFPAQRPVSFDVFFDLRLNKWLSKQSWGWWFEIPLCPLWHHCNELWLNRCCKISYILIFSSLIFFQYISVVEIFLNLSEIRIKYWQNLLETKIKNCQTDFQILFRNV